MRKLRGAADSEKSSVKHTGDSQPVKQHTEHNCSDMQKCKETKMFSVNISMGKNSKTVSKSLRYDPREKPTGKYPSINCNQLFRGS